MASHGAAARDVLLAQKASLVAERFLQRTQEAAAALSARTVELEETGRALGRIDRELAGALRDADQLGTLAHVRLNNAAQTVTALAASLRTHSDALSGVLADLAHTDSGVGGDDGADSGAHDATPGRARPECWPTV